PEDRAGRVAFNQREGKRVAVLWDGTRQPHYIDPDFLELHKSPHSSRSTRFPEPPPITATPGTMTTTLRDEITGALIYSANDNIGASQTHTLRISGRVHAAALRIE